MYFQATYFRIEGVLQFPLPYTFVPCDTSYKSSFDNVTIPARMVGVLIYESSNAGMSI
jgi:hypothetical protein